MTLQDILLQAEQLPLTDQIHLISQLVQRLEQHIDLSTPTPQKPSLEPPKSTAAVGIIADLIQNPIPFDGSPLPREQIYDR